MIYTNLQCRKYLRSDIRNGSGIRYSSMYLFRWSM
jgi:hypothetical protein